jgi:uncharacterized protein YigE (DUF2233 family)
LAKVIDCVLIGIVLLSVGELQASNKRWHFKLLEKDVVKSSLGYYRKTQFTAGQTVFISHCVVLKHPGKYLAEVIDQPVSSLDEHPTIEQIAAQSSAVAAINGGYFLPNFSPAGLFILAGNEVSPLSKQASLSGILSISSQGEISLLSRNASTNKSLFAIQAGPFLIDPGGNMGIKAPGAENRRTVIGTTVSKKVFLVNTSPVSLFDLAYLLKSKPSAFGLSKVDRALNLDGGPSSAMFIQLSSIELTIKEKLPVRNFLVIRHKKIKP